MWRIWGGSSIIGYCNCLKKVLFFVHQNVLQFNRKLGAQMRALIPKKPGGCSMVNIRHASAIRPCLRLVILAISLGITASCQAATPIPESTLVPTPAPTSTPSLAPEPQILSAASNICESAWNLPTKIHPDRMNAAGSTLTLIATNDQAAKWTWAGEYFVLPDMEDPAALDLQSVICIQESLNKVGFYLEIGKDALVRNWTVRLMSWPDGLVINEAFFSVNPPNSIQAGESGIGAAPVDKLFSWAVNPPNGRAIQVWHEQYSASTHGVRLSPDGKLLVVYLEDSTMKLLDLATGEDLHTFNRDGPFDFSADGKMLFSYSATKITTWDIASGLEKQTLPMPFQEADTFGFPKLRFMTDGRILALTISEQGIIKLWDVMAGTELVAVNLSPDFDPTQSWAEARLSPDAKTLATAVGEKGIIKLWDMMTGKELRELKTSIDGVITDIEFSSDSSSLAITEGSSAISLWNISTGVLTATIRSSAFNFYPPSTFSPDGRWLAVCDINASPPTLKMWDTATGQEILTAFPESCRWNFWPGNETLVATIGSQVEYRDTTTGELVHSVRLISTPLGGGVIFLPDGNSVVMWDPFGGLELWDVRAGN
jgi:WD40 repeat protein